MVSKVEKYGKSTCFIDFFTCHIDFQRAWHYFKKYIFSVVMYFCQVTSILKGLGSYRKTGILSFCGFLPSRIDSQRAELRLLEVRPRDCPRSMKPFPACVPGGYRKVACRIKALGSPARATVQTVLMILHQGLISSTF